MLGFYPVPLLPAISQPGLVVSLPVSASIAQCAPHNAALLGGGGTSAFDFNIQITEGNSSAFQERNFGTNLSSTYPAALAGQNVLGYPYRTETMFYSPSIFTSAPALGLADFGTRILVTFGAPASGTHLFVPTTVDTNAYGENELPAQLQLVQANQYGNSAPGYIAVPSTATIGTTPVAEATRSGNLAYAVYEVINSNPDVVESATIPVAVAFTNTPPVETVQALTTLAPLGSVTTASQSAAIPRFANLSSPETAYSITACTGAKK